MCHDFQNIHNILKGSIKNARSLQTSLPIWSYKELQTVVIISRGGGGGGEFVLICLARYGSRCVFRVFFRGLLSFLVCYIVTQQSQSVLCGSVLTTMAPKTENIRVKTTNILFLKRLAQAQSWQFKSWRSVRSATAKKKSWASRGVRSNPSNPPSYGPVKGQHA